MQATQHLSLGATVPAVGQRDGVPVAQRDTGNVDRPTSGRARKCHQKKKKSRDGLLIVRQAYPAGNLQPYRLPTEATERRLHTGFRPMIEGRGPFGSPSSRAGTVGPRPRAPPLQAARSHRIRVRRAARPFWPMMFFHPADRADSSRRMRARRFGRSPPLHIGDLPRWSWSMDAERSRIPPLACRRGLRPSLRKHRFEPWRATGETAARACSDPALAGRGAGIGLAVIGSAPAASTRQARNRNATALTASPTRGRNPARGILAGLDDAAPYRAECARNRPRAAHRCRCEWRAAEANSSSVKRPRISSVAFLVRQEHIAHITGSEAAMRVKSRTPLRNI